MAGPLWNRGTGMGRMPMDGQESPSDVVVRPSVGNVPHPDYNAALASAAIRAASSPVEAVAVMWPILRPGLASDFP